MLISIILFISKFDLADEFWFSISWLEAVLYHHNNGLLDKFDYLFKLNCSNSSFVNS